MNIPAELVMVANQCDIHGLREEADVLTNIAKVLMTQGGNQEQTQEQTCAECGRPISEHSAIDAQRCGFKGQGLPMPEQDINSPVSQHYVGTEENWQSPMDKALGRD